ncbi:uncharacterized protein [Nothobranchius furzeri]|uniref:Uncharacterized LOC107395692 n=2 Tax=Nothobranchius furzeri TaxID=105023 RepID=A0A8C6NWL8_NOTFU
MNSLKFVFFILVPHSFGRCFDISFSICWLGKHDALSRLNENLWLNGTSLKSIMKHGKVTSLTVSPFIENKLSLQLGGSFHRWTLTISPRTKIIKITGRQRPSEQPTNATKSSLNLLSLNEVFACESGTTFLHQDENFFLAVGHTSRFPVKLESRNPTMLLVSWVENDPDELYTHTVTLYNIEMGSYYPFFRDSTSLSHYRFTALEACSHYVVCVEIEETHSLTCLSTITDPDIPRDLEVTSWNSSSISLAWDCPVNLKYSNFLLTVFYLNGTGHVTEEEELWLVDDSFTITLSDLPPCVRLKFGLQTVCQAGIESRYSRMVLNDGNSAFSNIELLSQKSFGPDKYTLEWEVRNTSSISMFRVYHKGALHGTTLFTRHTVGGLLPCHKYQAKVEAFCGENVLMSAKTITAHTGPRGVSDLHYRSSDSTAMWTPSDPNQPAVAYIYKLSLQNGTTIESSRVSKTELPLPQLEPGKPYVLDVWEECDGQWESTPAHLSFQGANSPFEVNVRAINPQWDRELDSDNVGLKMVVPWALPEDLQDNSKVEQIFKHKLQELLEDFEQPARIELESFKLADEKTEIKFWSFDASKTEDVQLPVDDQLNYISSMNFPNVSVRSGVIYWEGPDFCSSRQLLCPQNSACINTLGSYLCVCQHGYHDVSSFIEAPAALHPVCKDKGLFNQCLHKVMTGGISKAYLTSLFEGNIEVKLNDGRCLVNESEALYYFHMPRKSSVCGTEKQVNNSHIVLQNTLTISLTEEQTITRQDLKVVWKCIYPRHYIRNAEVAADMEWLSSLALVGFNSSLPLGLTMMLYRDESYTSPYTDAAELWVQDSLFFQVALQTNSSFTSDVLLQVESCWATEGTDPMDAVQAVFLHEGCPVDETFHWLSANGLSQSSRFSLQMFKMPKGLPLYFHCLTNICGRDEDCTKNCTSQQRPKRSVSQMDREEKRVTVVSAGPLTVSTRVKSVHPSYWTEAASTFVVVASISFLGMGVISLIAIKAVMTYYEHMQPK